MKCAVKLLCIGRSINLLVITKFEAETCELTIMCKVAPLYPPWGLSRARCVARATEQDRIKVSNS